ILYLFNKDMLSHFKSAWMDSDPPWLIHFTMNSLPALDLIWTEMELQLPPFSKLPSLLSCFTAFYLESISNDFLLNYSTLSLP
ncbi:hypothetical protein TRIATDRAFT_258844, partial [Trichoderma atroviride IMI 206040]